MRNLAEVVSLDVSLAVAALGLLVLPRAPDVEPVAIETPSSPIATTMSVVPVRGPVLHPGACSDRYDFKFAVGHVGADGIADSIVTRTFADGRAVSEDWQRPDAPHRTLAISYDAAGNRSREVLRLFRGRDVSYHTYRYDRAGRLIESGIDEDIDGKPEYVDLRTYDTRGRLATLRESVHAGSRRGGVAHWYHYGANGEIDVERVDNDGDRVANFQIDYTYLAGKLSAKHTHWYGKGRDVPIDQLLTFAYDATGRLATETDANGFAWVHHYDEAGNLVMKEHRLPARLNDPTPLVRIVYTYDCF